MRLRVIAACLWFGLMPWPLYEARCHYHSMSYVAHLWLNLAQARVWLSRQETQEDRDFEAGTNPAWSRINWTR